MLDHSGVGDVYVDVSNELVLVETTLPSSRVKQLLAETGKLVVFRGFGGKAPASDSSSSHHGAAVIVMKGQGRVQGLARMVQVGCWKVLKIC